jgi:hypothetical protein
MFNFLLPDRLYKFVYDNSHGYSWGRKECVVLVTAKSAAEAVKKFHELTDNKVKHISEFIELTYPTVIGVEGDKKNGE